MPQSVHETLNEKFEALTLEAAEQRNARAAAENDKHEIEDALADAQVCALHNLR